MNMSKSIELVQRCEVITNPYKAYRCLNGLINIYKPAKKSTRSVIIDVKRNLSKDLNAIDNNDTKPMVRIARTDNKSYSVDVVPNLAQDILATGSRFPLDNFLIYPASSLGFETSGVLMLGINKTGTSRTYRLQKGSPIETYHVTGRLGTQTMTDFAGSMVMHQATYDHVTRGKLDGLLASMQADYQKQMFDSCGINLQTQEAYDLACKGLIRPGQPTECIIYGTKCIAFKRNNFTLEVNCMNATEERLISLITKIAINLRTLAHCIKIRRTRYGFFSYENALLRGEIHLSNIIQNIAECEQIWYRHPNMVDREVTTPVGTNIKNSDK